MHLTAIKIPIETQCTAVPKTHQFLDLGKYISTELKDVLLNKLEILESL